MRLENDFRPRSRSAAFPVAWPWPSSEMLLPCGIGHLLPCGIPRAHCRDASSSFLQLTFASRAPAAKHHLRRLPAEHPRKPLAFAFEILLAAATLPLRFRGRRWTTSRSSSLQRLMLDGMLPASGPSASAILTTLRARQFFRPPYAPPIEPSDTPGRPAKERVTAPSARRRARSRMSARQYDHSKLEVPSIEEVPDELPHGNPPRRPPSVGRRTEAPHVFIDV